MNDYFREKEKLDRMQERCDNQIDLDEIRNKKPIVVLCDEYARKLKLEKDNG